MSKKSFKGVQRAETPVRKRTLPKVYTDCLLATGHNFRELLTSAPCSQGRN